MIFIPSGRPKAHGNSSAESVGKKKGKTLARDHRIK
jgi:hypothetical protein